ncbi:MAG: ComEC/Rec2 family competence protein [Patescibacteria group bacterium]
MRGSLFPSRVLLAASLAFVAGVFLNSLFPIAPFVFLALGLLSFALVRKVSFAALLGFCLLALTLGVARHGQASQEAAERGLEGTAFEGIVVAEPQVKGSKVRLVVVPEDFPQEKVLVTASAFEEFSYGDKVEVQGNVEAPPSFEGFDYEAFLAKDGIRSVVWQGEVQVKEHKAYTGALPFLQGAMFSFKERMRSALKNNIPPPESEVLAAILLGDKGRMAPDLGEKLNRAGVRHITAISGMHVMLLGALAMGFLQKVGLWRRQAVIGALCLLFVFVAITGFQVSAVRAFLMGGLYFAGELFGRPKASLRALLYVGAFLLFLNPLLLFHDAGFQLSFAAVLGIILLLPWLSRKLQRVPDALGLRTVLAMSIAAQLFTFPLLLWHFGAFSVVSPFSNLLIVPLLPLLLGLGIPFLLLGSLQEGIASVLGLFLFFPLRYLMGVVDVFSSLSFAFLPASSLFLWIGAGAVLLLFAVLFWRDWKARNLF